MIKPTVGRIVHYIPSAADRDEGIATISGQPLAATVVGVWSDTCVNLSIHDANGYFFSRTSVLLYQGDGERPEGNFAEWMPYQKGQAAKTEEMEKQASRLTSHPGWEGAKSLADLQNAVSAALKTAAGGVHANASCPVVERSELANLIDAVKHLHSAAHLLERSPDFRVLDSAAGPIGE